MRRKAQGKAKQRQRRRQRQIRPPREDRLLLVQGLPPGSILDGETPPLVLDVSPTDMALLQQFLAPPTRSHSWPRARH